MQPASIEDTPKNEELLNLPSGSREKLTIFIEEEDKGEEKEKEENDNFYGSNPESGTTFDRLVP